jgi:hypothetical protein
VNSGSTDVFGIGGYHLRLAPVGGPSISPSPSISIGSSLDTPVDASNASLSNAQVLTTTPGYVEHTYYEVDDATLDAASPTQSFRVRAADLGPGVTNVMTVVVAAMGEADASLQTTVVDAQGRPIDATVLHRAIGQLEVQVPSVRSNADYFVVVRGTKLGTVPADFSVTVDFDQDGSHLATFVNDSLSPDQPGVVRSLQVLKSQQFHLVLAASDWNNPVATGLKMIIDDSHGQAVFSMNVADGQIRKADVFLNQGAYTVRFLPGAGTISSLLSFQLSGTTESEPLGPQLRDTTLEAVDEPLNALSLLTFYWLPAGSNSLMSGAGGQKPALTLVAGASATSSSAASVTVSTQKTFDELERTDASAADGMPLFSSATTEHAFKTGSKFVDTNMTFEAAASSRTNRVRPRPHVSQLSASSGIFPSVAERAGDLTESATAEITSPSVEYIEEIGALESTNTSALAVFTEADEASGIDSPESTQRGFNYWAFSLSAALLSHFLRPLRSLDTSASASDREMGRLRRCLSWRR